MRIMIAIIITFITLICALIDSAQCQAPAPNVCTISRPNHIGH